eukprot:COSAG01_NODE_6280_length_3755_cov_33.946663_2_plen_193_part_00
MRWQLSRLLLATLLLAALSAAAAAGSDDTTRSTAPLPRAIGLSKQPTAGNKKGGWIGAVELDSTNFSSVVGSRASRPWVVEYKSLYCGTCIAFEPEFKAVVRALGGHEAWWKNHLNFAQVILEHDAGLQLAESEGALGKGVPAIFVYDAAAMSRGVTRRVEVSAGQIVVASRLRGMIMEAVHQLEREEEGVR